MEKIFTDVKKATDGSSGFDLLAALRNKVILQPGETKLIPCGFSLQMPFGFEAQVRPRSGIALKNSVTVLNTPGTIDADYRGEICVILINHGKNIFEISPGMRIAQLIFMKLPEIELEVTQELDETDRVLVDLALQEFKEKLFKVHKKIIYAIEAVVDIALNSGPNPVQNESIARRQGIPKRYLEQTLQILVKNKILVGSRGPKEGIV